LGINILAVFDFLFFPVDPAKSDTETPPIC